MARVESDVELERDGCRLSGTLARPEPASEDRTVVLLVAGSGPTDRDGNAAAVGLRTDCLRQLAAALAEGGVASLRYDKRGIGRSATGASDERTLRFETYVEDATGWLRMLGTDTRFDRIAVLGHSEGALIAALCAAIMPVSAVISVAGTARPAGVLLRSQLAGRLSGPLTVAHEAILAGLEAGRTTDEVPPELHALYRPSVQPYLVSWLRRRPLDAVVALQVALLVVQGAADAQVDVEDGRLLAAARSGARLAIIDGMDHVLKRAAPDAASYTDQTRPLAPGLADSILRFLDDPR
jgi:alpha-beta hydrolase superfamily lysophospholipase